MQIRRRVTSVLLPLGLCLSAHAATGQNAATYLDAQGNIDAALVEEHANAIAFTVLEAWIAQREGPEIHAAIAAIEE